jgi:toxin-antitoxin system PIN domain toxin
VSVTVDANLLLYATDEASPFHDGARRLLEELATGPGIVYVFWPTVMAYLRLSTHPSVFERPLSPTDAIANVDRLLGLPHVQGPGEQDRFWHVFRGVAGEADARGNLVGDAHLVALMVQNGVRAIWTHDRDFRRFPGIEVRDPFAGEAPR